MVRRCARGYDKASDARGRDPGCSKKYHANSCSGNSSKRSMHRQLQKLPRSSVCHDKSRRRPELRARWAGERT